MSNAPQAFPLHIPFARHLGLELWAYGDGQAELRMTVNEALLNGWGVAHGGALMTLLDVAMAHAARSPRAADAARSAAAGDAEQTPGVATVEMKTTFMQPAEGRLRALGRLLHRTATLAFCEASVLDERGQLCAHATGTFKVLRALPTRDRQLNPLRQAPLPPATETPP